MCFELKLDNTEASSIYIYLLNYPQQIKIKHYAHTWENDPVEGIILLIGRVFMTGR